MRKFFFCSGCAIAKPVWKSLWISGICRRWRIARERCAPLCLHDEDTLGALALAMRARADSHCPFLPAQALFAGANGSRFCMRLAVWRWRLRGVVAWPWMLTQKKSPCAGFRRVREVLRKEIVRDASFIVEKRNSLTGFW